MIYSEFKRDIQGNPYLSWGQNLYLTNVMRAERDSVAPMHLSYTLQCWDWGNGAC